MGDGGRARVLRHRLRSVSPGRELRGSHAQGREAGRLPKNATSSSGHQFKVPIAISTTAERPAPHRRGDRMLALGRRIAYDAGDTEGGAAGHVAPAFIASLSRSGSSFFSPRGPRLAGRHYRPADQLDDLHRRQRHLADAHVERRQRILDRRDQRGGGRNGAGLADALDAERIERRGRLLVERGRASAPRSRSAADNPRTSWSPAGAPSS